MPVLCQAPTSGLCLPILDTMGKILHPVFGWDLWNSLMDTRNLLLIWCLFLHLFRHWTRRIVGRLTNPPPTIPLLRWGCLPGLNLTLSESIACLPPTKLCPAPVWEQGLVVGRQSVTFCVKAQYHEITGPPDTPGILHPCCSYVVYYVIYVCMRYMWISGFFYSNI